eukprot:6269041-Amphidinium_carterae.1
MWWIKMKDVVKRGAQGGTSAGAPDTMTGEQLPEETTFRAMAPMRNLVRAWEMRNDGAFKQGYSWSEVSGIEKHPADMTILAQGAVMTPTVMKAGQWETWSYADLMDPVSLLAMLKKDCKGHDSLTDFQRKSKLRHVILPLLDTLGFKLVGLNNSEWTPQCGINYYTFLEAEAAHLKKKVQVPDASVLINHNSKVEADQIYYLGVNVPSRVVSRKIVDKSPENQNQGVQKALLRYQTLQLHGMLTTVPHWDRHESYIDRRIAELHVWRRPINQHGVEMSSTFPGRTPLTLVRSITPTRKKVEDTSMQEEATKRRKLDDTTSVGDGTKDVPMETSVANLSTDVLSRREGTAKTVEDARAEWMEIDHEVDVELSDAAIPH